MKLLDVNILIYAHRKDMDQHGCMKKWFEEALPTKESCAVSGLVLSACWKPSRIEKFLIHGRLASRSGVPPTTTRPSI